MKTNILKSLPLIVITLATLAIAQSVITPELLQQYNTRGGSQQLTPDMLNRLNAAQAAQLGTGARMPSIFTTPDTAAAAPDSSQLDSTALSAQDDFFDVKKQRGYSGHSVYEVMFKGVDLLPDDILPYLQMFGYDAFNQRGTQEVRPGDLGGVPSDYPVKIGDEVRVHLWGRINQDYALTIDRTGSISIPHIGPVKVAGLSYNAMQRAVTDRLKNIEGVNVSLTMGELRPIGVYIVGEVKNPGFHTVSPLTSVTNALFAAGGISNRGSLRTVQLKRRGNLVSEVDYYDFLMTGDDKSGLRLQAGDVIVVPIVRQMAAVVGNVRRSALYELKGPTKLSAALDLAGGLSPAAWTSRIQVERFQGNERRVVLDIEADDISKSSFNVIDGDVVKVFPVLSKDDNVVHLEGNVLRPGKYEYKDGMRVRDVLASNADLLPETYFEYAVVMRRTQPTFLERVITFDLGGALDDAASEHNMALEPYDRLIVYHRDFFEPERVVSVSGAVTAPGDYKLFQGMTIRDLILQAGGLREDASTERGELYRRRLEGESASTEKIEFGVTDVMLGNSEHNRLLRRGDKVFIRNRRNWEPERKVTLSGQFVYPGTYIIFEDETLGDVITRAGGFRDKAYLPAALFIRKSVKETEERRMRQYVRGLEMDMVRLSVEMTSKGLHTAQLFEQQARLGGMVDPTMIMGRVMIDMTDDDQYKDFILEDGDELFVPQNLNTVSVLGDVYNQGTFRYETRRPTVQYYLNNSGGPLESANRKAMYIIRANGTIVSDRVTRIRDLELAPGDVVVVPTRIRYPNRFKTFLESADATLKISALITSIITLVLVLKTMNDSGD